MIFGVELDDAKQAVVGTHFEHRESSIAVW
jgi:hypothetical protein